jgi:hypothetical protein
MRKDAGAFRRGGGGGGGDGLVIFTTPQFFLDLGIHVVALQVAFERQTLKPFFSLDRL